MADAAGPAGPAPGRGAEPETGVAQAPAARGGTGAGSGSGPASDPGSGRGQQGTGEDLEGKGKGTGPRRPGAIRITSPRDGFSLSPDDPPIVIVEGQVEDVDITSIVLVANDHRVTVRVRDGRFKHAIPLLERVTRLFAEVTGPGDVPSRSAAVTVNNTFSGQVSVLALDASALAPGAQIEVTASWRPNADRLEDVVNGLPVKTFQTAPDVEPQKFFFLRHNKPGVYNFVVRDPSGNGLGSVGAQFFRLLNGRVSVRDVTPALIGPGTSKVMVRMLFPQGVLWDQNDWFTGRSEGPETITKFRFPDGTSWIERKSDLR